MSFVSSSRPRRPRGGRFMASPSGGSWPRPMAGTMSVPRSIDEDLDDREPERHRQHHVGQKRHHLRHVAREHVARELADVGEDRAPLFDAGHDAREVVVEQHDLRGLARHVGARRAHGDAHVGRAQRRRVVDAVAGHRDEEAHALDGAHDLELLLGRRAREDAARPRAGARRSPSRASTSSASPVSTASAGASGGRMPACSAMARAVSG